MVRSIFIIFCFILSNIAILFTSTNRCVNRDSDERTRPNLDSSYFSENNQFQIHYDIEGSNAPDLIDLNNNNIPDYVEEVASIAEASKEMLVNTMGYLIEPDDGDGVYDIYIINQTAWGWNVPESASTGASFVKIDNDYLGNSFNSNFCFDPIDKMKISVAHEFFHAIQRAYRPNYNTDHDFLLEMSSMWFEDLMVPDCNDYLSFTNYSSGIFKKPNQKFDGSESVNSATFGYSMALFGHYLSTIVDQDGAEDEKNSTIIRQIWENYQNQSNQDNINAAGQSIIEVVSNYGSLFSNVWSDFIARNMFSGVYNHFNQDFYYYPDQQYMDALTFNHPSTSIGVGYQDEMSLSLDIYASNILKFHSTENQMISLSYINSGCSINRASIIGDENRLLNSEDLAIPIVLKPSDLIYFVSISEGLDCDDFNLQISSQTIPTDLVLVYPNPIYYEGHISIEIDSYEDINDFVFELYDINGRLLLKQDNRVFSNPLYLNINEILKSSGIYFLRLYYNKKSFVYKFSYIK